MTLYFLLQFIFSKNSPIVLNSSTSTSKSTITFSFQTSAASPYTYIKIYYIYSFTVVFLIFIFKYNLYVVTNSYTLLNFLSNKGDVANSAWDPLLGFCLALSFNVTNSFYILTKFLFLFSWVELTSSNISIGTSNTLLVYLTLSTNYYSSQTVILLFLSRESLN